MRLETIPEGSGIKVVIGTRTYLGDDWTHVDIDPTPLRDKDGVFHSVDVACDARKIMLPDDYADIVYTSECLEHFPYKEYQAVLFEWCRIVKPGGMIRIEVPDFLLACKQILEWDCLEGDRRMQQIFFAEQLNEFDFHYVGLTERMLSDDFESIGFEVVDVKRGDEWGWLKVDAVKPLVDDR
jgi:predicted SAM-dependent methyltransferase